MESAVSRFNPLAQSLLAASLLAIVGKILPPLVQFRIKVNDCIELAKDTTTNDITWLSMSDVSVVARIGHSPVCWPPWRPLAALAVMPLGPWLSG